MPMPSPGVISAILDLYIDRRKKDWESPKGKVIETGQWLLTFATTLQNKDTDQVERTKICNKLKDDANNAYQSEEEYKFRRSLDLIFELAQQANSAKGTLFSETLYLIISYMVSELTKELGSLHTAFLGIMNDFKTQKVKLKEEINTLRNSHRGLGVPQKIDKLNEIILKLAYLGDTDSVDEAVDRNLVPNLRILTQDECKAYEADLSGDIHLSRPLCLQHKTAKFVYSKEYQSITTLSFEEFCLRTHAKWEILQIEIDQNRVKMEETKKQEENRIKYELAEKKQRLINSADKPPKEEDKEEKKEELDDKSKQDELSNEQSSKKEATKPSSGFGLNIFSSSNDKEKEKGKKKEDKKEEKKPTSTPGLGKQQQN